MSSRRLPLFLMASIAVAAACSSGGGGGGGSSSGSPTATPTPTSSGTPVAPSIVYSGAPGGTIPGWNASAPLPLVVFAHQNASGSNFFTAATIGDDGTLGGIVADTVTVWSWTGAGGPALLYHGTLGSALVPAWNAASPRPLLAFSRQNGASGGTAVANGRLLANGTLDQIAADEIWIWGWNTGGPTVRSDATLSSSVVANWNTATPFPVLTAVRENGTSNWYDPPLAVQIQDDGSIVNLVTDRVVLYQF